MTMKVAKAFDSAAEFAQSWVGRTVPYSFTDLEKRILDSFFSNTDKHTFLLENLPSNVQASLLAMYSRIQNARGLRGVFLDKLVVHFLAGKLKLVEQHYGGDAARFLKANADISSIDSFASFSFDAKNLVLGFIEHATGDGAYVRDFANGDRTRRFLSTWLDAYGHNSIARLGTAVVCCEEISILAAKALEHLRVGAGFIELSTRYVDMTRAYGYDIIGELIAAGYEDVGEAKLLQAACSKTYLNQQVNCSQALGQMYPDASEGAIFGEVCDVMANALPASVNTSVGCVISGEALPGLIRALYLENLHETTALADLIRSELKRSGLGQFARHVEPTPFQLAHTGYLVHDEYGADFRNSMCSLDARNADANIYHALLERYGAKGSVDQHSTIASLLKLHGLTGESRGEHDRLPPLFETVTAHFRFRMSFRTQREIQRHVLCRNERTLLTPDLGFYEYDKPMPHGMRQAFDRLVLQARQTYRNLLHDGVAPEVLQYLLPLGFNVGATLTANLRQLEFLLWQRSKFNVNHEARQIVLMIDQELRDRLAWWESISRTDRTRAYRLAREKEGVPL